MLTSRSQIFEAELASARIQQIIAGRKLALHIVCTGGGGGIAGMFLDEPGVSRILEGITIPYATTEFDMLISHEWDASGYKYCSWEGAIALGQAAFFIAQEAMARKGDFVTPCI